MNMSRHLGSQHAEASRSAARGGSAKQSVLSCSTCGKTFRLDQSPTPPFCSEMCQMIDLGRWLDEDIGVPHEGGNADDPRQAESDMDSADNIGTQDMTET